MSRPLSSSSRGETARSIFGRSQSLSLSVVYLRAAGVLFYHFETLSLSVLTRDRRDCRADARGVAHAPAVRLHPFVWGSAHDECGRGDAPRGATKEGLGNFREDPKGGASRAGESSAVR